MEDSKIVELYWQRNETAIGATEEKYGPYCHTVAFNILESMEDSEECVNDTWLRAWNAMPPQRPALLSAFLAKITRNLAINRLHERRAAKRGGGQAQLAIAELDECVAGSDSVEAEFDRRELERDISRFLRGLPRREREIFLRRYFFVESSGDIAARFRIRESGVLVILSRTRKKLRAFLQKEGYIL